MLCLLHLQILCIYAEYAAYAIVLHVLYIYSGASLWRGLWDHGGCRLVLVFSLYQGEKARKCGELGPTNLRRCERFLLCPTSL